MTAIDDIAAERKRQIEKEGWNAGHDDQHHQGDIARAAAAYAVASLHSVEENKKHKDALYGVALGFISIIRWLWPWDAQWFKPKDRRRNLVIAGALIVAEIDRLDREAAEVRPTSPRPQTGAPVRMARRARASRATERKRAVAVTRT